MKEIALVLLLVCVCACIGVVVGSSYLKAKQQKQQAIQQVDDARQQATKDLENFAYISNATARATNDAFWHTNHIETAIGLKLSVAWWDNRSILTNQVGDKEYAVYVEVKNGGFLFANSCGHAVMFGAGTIIPTNDVPCPCGNTNHWLWKFGKL